MLKSAKEAESMFGDLSRKKGQMTPKRQIKMKKL